MAVDLFICLHLPSYVFNIFSLHLAQSGSYTSATVSLGIIRSEMTSPKIKLSHSRYIAKVLSLTNLLSLWIWFVLLSRVPMRKVRALTSALVKLSHSNWSLSIILYIFSPLGPHDSYFYKRVLVRKGCTLSLSKFSWRSQVLKKSRLHSLPWANLAKTLPKHCQWVKGFAVTLKKPFVSMKPLS